MPAALRQLRIRFARDAWTRLEERSSTLAPSADTKSELAFLRILAGNVVRARRALATYQGILRDDPDHTEAMFRAAVLCDQSGDDDGAIDLYERCVSRPPTHVNAMINLAILYEDQGRLEDADDLLESVVEEYPNHPRAAQFLKSVESSFGMAVDELAQREREGRVAVMDMSIADFELSVRSRNCLKQMNIRTLGDLLRISEPELLSYRNFGETSLNEIKALLAQRGMRLGQGAPVVEPPVVPRINRFVGDASLQMRKPIAELELSVRSRKCLQRLGVSTIGELAARSEAELLTIKNFGQTSLNEIKQQLSNFGLSLRAST